MRIFFKVIRNLDEKSKKYTDVTHTIVGGKATQKEIEDHLQVSHPTIVGIVSRLEKNGFVACSVDEKDRRNKIVCATCKALNTVDAMRIGKQKMEERLTKGISETELAEFNRIINLMCKNI